MKLRKYQQDCVDQLMRNIKNKTKDIIVLPTGAGKSIVIAKIIELANVPCLILQPSKEILTQNYNKLKQIVPEGDMAIYSASLKEKKINKYTFATIGSVYKTPELFDYVKLVIIDECHQLNNKSSDSMFMSLLDKLNVKIIGLTATPFRLYPTYFMKFGSLYQSVSTKMINRTLNKKSEKFWDDIVFNMSNKQLTQEGFLSPIQYRSIDYVAHEKIPLNKSQTEFDLEKYWGMLTPKQQDICQEIINQQSISKSILVFCSTLEQAHKLSNIVEGSRVVSSKSTAEERDEVIEGFKKGDIKVVFNVGVLTTGFDMPELDCIITLRPTRSISLWIQMIGRGVRIAPNKTHCDVIDFSGNIKYLGKLEDIEVKKVDYKWNVCTPYKPQGWNGVELYNFKIK